MIDVMFQMGSDLTLIRISGKKLMFSKVRGVYMLWADIEGLKFGVAGILKEFPDLESLENKEIIKIGKKRFKEHIQKMNSEEEIKQYLIKDLSSHGYRAKYTQRKGHRPIKCR